MPEFLMDKDGEVNGQSFGELSPFLQGYLEAMFFTNCASGISMVEWEEPENQELVREGQADGDLPTDAGFGDIYPDSLIKAHHECSEFQQKARALLSQAYGRDYDATQAGRDFWFTRCGHGVGFWDRDQLKADDLGDKLTEIAESFGNRDASFGEAASGEESPTGYGFVFIE
jgi:hypothetical protein